MDLRLRNRKVLVTGASKGIGAAVAQAFAAEGANLVLNARDEAKLASLAEELRSTFDVEVQVRVADLRDQTQLVKLGEAVEDIDILVNNAGDIPGGTLSAVDEAAWRHGWELKVFGYINLTRLVYGAMKRRGCGVIVNNIGSAGERLDQNYIAGSTGNAALMSFTRALGQASLFDGIRVVGVNPGPVATERSTALKRLEATRRWGDSERYGDIYKLMPLGRPARCEEVADLIVFLASDRASYVSGSIHTIDGGGGLRPQLTQ